MNKESGFHIVFSVTSRGRDVYSAMTRLAAASIRITNPDAFLTVAVDHETDSKIRERGDFLTNEVDGWLRVETPDGPPAFRNRMVKIRLNSYIKTSFLYLDSDILVRSWLHQIFTSKCLGVTYNHSTENCEKQVWNVDRGVFAANGWPLPWEGYFNAGLLFFKGEKIERELAVLWEELFRRSVEKTKIYRDQPAFNRALAIIGCRKTILSKNFNHQFRVQWKGLSNAKIWHYYYSSGKPPDTRWEEEVQSVVESQTVRIRRIRALVRASHPWRGSTIGSQFLLRGLESSGNFRSWQGRVLKGGWARGIGVSVKRRGSMALSKLFGRLRGFGFW